MASQAKKPTKEAKENLAAIIYGLLASNQRMFVIMLVVATVTAREVLY
ncbi:MAG: hypothetical protein U9M98_00140 [Patescibacteria group bacterium]|nr:hypothetical protein [Patescibacteria group bacterium]